MKKTLFEEPEMEVVRFDAKDAFIATSGGCIGVDDTPQDEGACADEGCEIDEGEEE